MIGRAFQADPRIHQTPECIGEGRPRRIADRYMEEPRRAGRRGRTAAALPGVQADVVVISACRDEGGLITHPLLKLEANHSAPELKRSLDIGDLEVDVTDIDKGV